MKDRIALVTGGMGGIGSIIAQYLVKHGCEVAVTYYKDGNHAIAQQWQQQQKQQGYDFSIFYADLSNFQATEQLINQVISKFGKIDILVNNAGVTEDSTLAKMSPEQWHKVIDNNLHSTFNVTRNVLKEMIKNQYGRIINISSINGQKGQFGQTNYCASKAGIHGFTKALAYEVARKGITVNTISPGYVKTSMLEKIAPNILDDIIKQIPIGRLAEPHEIARAVGFLAAADAGYITGSNFCINGGQHMF
jgi:acetoacetyl-CoA reductase